MPDSYRLSTLCPRPLSRVRTTLPLITATFNIAANFRRQCVRKSHLRGQILPTIWPQHLSSRTQMLDRFLTHHLSLFWGGFYAQLPPPPTPLGGNQPKHPPQYPGIFSTKPTPAAVSSRLYCAFLCFSVYLLLCVTFFSCL
jgi:hypothetical protein